MQSYGTPFLTEPLLSDIGLRGDGPKVDDILEGTYDHPDVDPITKVYIQELCYPNDYTYDDDVNKVTPSDNKYDLHRTKERTSSSPSGLHYGMWKANSMHDLLNDTDTIFRDISLRHGIVYKRWMKAIDVELLKEEGNFNIKRLRTIVLIEADHQLNAKRIGKIAMRRSDCRERRWIADEQYGCRKHHRAIEVVLNSRLVDDGLRLYRKPAIICSNNAKSCFDRIVLLVFAICLQRIGCPREAINSCIDTLQNLHHHIRTAFGDSKDSYTGTEDQPLQGLVQGYGPAPAGWVLVSSPIINMMKNAGYGYKAWSAINAEVMQMVCFSFVDDTTLASTLEDGNNNLDELIEHTQNALNAWQGGLMATGGTLVPPKSYWFLIDFKCSQNGNWRYKTIAETPGKLFLTTPHEGVTELQRHEVTMGTKELGVKNRHDGKDKENVIWFRQKTQKWADKVRSGYLKPNDAWLALTTTIMKSTEYPLAATCFTKRQCDYIMAPALKEGLRAYKMQSKFPRAVAFGALEAQGAGILSLHTLQHIEHLQVLARHGDAPSITGNLIRHDLEAHILELGSKRQFWNLNPDQWACICTDSWLKSIWMDLSEHEMQILDTIKRPQPGSSTDDNITDFFVTTVNGKINAYFKLINWCRMYLKIIFISDMLLPNGQEIHPDIWNCHPRKDLSTPYISP